MALVSRHRSTRVSSAGTKVERCGIYHSMMASLRGMVIRVFDDRHVRMYARREVAPSGVMAVSMAGLTRSML